ncbi:hypothetical protein DH2020_004045 [Rehmannia glutinosa]|uniref:Uncharacterized protein n=1 Tax=Rehmannia glutinosa TaxID=99300 RepID=A0ABR0XNE6_REHGL
MHKLEASEGLRQEKLKQLRDYLHESCTSKRVVNIGEVAFVTSINLLSGTLFSLDFASFDSNSAQEMKETVQGLMKILGTPNLADYFPLLKLIDPQGLRRGSEDLIVAGADTTIDSVQWAMTELLRNPHKMTKAKDELRTIIGENKQVEELDISRLPYLQAVIKETFRCHPAGPFLVPHKAEANVEINGYIVPEDTQILVNVWAIGRDSRIWSNPDIFEPERFLDNKIDYRGQHFELIAYGSGKRMCPGLPLAHVMVHLMIASLIHNFDWKLEPGMKPEDLDLNEMFGLSLHKAIPLEAFPIFQ